MKRKLLSILLPAAALLLSQQAISGKSQPKFIGPYLGQTTPGNKPVPFAPGIVSTSGYEYVGLFAPDMKSFYFIRGVKGSTKQEFVTYTQKGEQWVQSEVSKRAGQPFITPDGDIMYLGRRFKERTATGWSEIKMLDAPFNDQLIMRLTASANGTRYFDTYKKGEDAFPIRYSRLVDGKYEAPQALSKTINTGTYLNHPFIAPDESYLIWDAKKEGGYGDSDLYISYRQKDGSWGEAINLGGEINSDSWDGAGQVTPDGKYFFFNRTISKGAEGELPDVDLLWVDASFIDELRSTS